MPQPFAPNNNVAAKFLLTGRTKDLEDIFNYLLAGNCVALYGERRGGKTLTLEVIESIINRAIDNYEGQLVDLTLVQALPGWKDKLANFTALFISLQGTRREAELLGKFLDEAKRVGLVTQAQLVKGKNKTVLPKTVEGLLRLLQEALLQNNQKLVILMDEMEVLGEYAKEVGSALAETFGDRVAYSNIYYVHAGSYQWRERVYSPGSNFTHLEAKYLSTIDEKEIINVLLQPLPADDKKSLIAQMTGGKPLYAQYLGKAVYENYPLTENDLLENSTYTSFREQIERNIFTEKGLDESSRKILAALAYHPNVTKNWLAKKLKLNEVDVGNRLNKLAQFGTIYKSEGRYGLTARFAKSIKRRFGRISGYRVESNSEDRYVILGKFIEIYGQKICDDPTRSEYGHAPKRLSQQLIPLARWVAMAVMIALAIALFLYTHPESTNRSFAIPNALIRVDVPGSLENDEDGTLSVTVTNTSNRAAEAFRLLFDSDKIRYNRSGLNSIPFSKIDSGETANEEIKYHVLTGNSDILDNRVSINNQIQFSFEINRRKVPLKRYSLLLTTVLTLFGLLVPWKSWASAVGLVKSLLTSGKGSANSGSGNTENDH